MEPAYDAIRSSVGRLNTRLENNLGGIHLIESVATESHESDRVEEASYDYFVTNWRRIKLELTYYPGTQILSNGSFWLAFLVGGYWVPTGTASGPLTGSLSVGSFVTFLFMSQRFRGSLRSISSVINNYENARASGERVFVLLDMPVHVTDRPDATALDGIEGRVEYDGVSFAYEEGEQVLHDTDFTAEPGETVALVGPTGVGKSTVMKLLLRFYDVSKRSSMADQSRRAIRMTGTTARSAWTGRTCAT